VIKKIFFYVFLVVVGAVASQYFLKDVAVRRPIEINDCNPFCFKTNEALGLLASIGVKYAPEYIPDKIYETDKTLAMVHPTAKTKHHYVIIPKKDVKNIAEVAEEDKIYLLDAIAVIQRIIADRKLETYQVVTNGPGYQDVTYLHFHLVSE